MDRRMKDYQQQRGLEWLEKCKQHAIETGTLESFEQCMDRVRELSPESGPEWFVPLCHHQPTLIEFQGTTMYGGVYYHGSVHGWSTNT